MLYDSCPFLFNTCTKIIKKSRAGMTQAKINRQKSCLFNYSHRTPFLIFPHYAPLRNNPASSLFCNSPQFAFFTNNPNRATYISAAYKQKNLQHQLRHWRHEVKKAATYSPTLHCSTTVSYTHLTLPTTPYV